MREQKYGLRLVAGLVACLAVNLAIADDNSGEAEPKVVEQPLSGGMFESLVRVTRIHGGCEVLNPDVGKAMPAVNEKAYPMGSLFRTGSDGSATLVFSSFDSITLHPGTELTVAKDEGSADTRVVQFKVGKLTFNLRDNLPEGAFRVVTPHACCCNMAGRGDYRISMEEGNEVFQAATITGSAYVDGPHYHVPALRAANTLNVITTPNRSLSRLTSVSGDFTVVLEKGDEKPAEYSMSPKAVVKIWRENAAVGGRTVISTLVVAPNGISRHRFAYVEGRPDLATGELVDPTVEEFELPALLSDRSKEDGEGAADNDDSPAPADNEGQNNLE